MSQRNSQVTEYTGKGGPPNRVVLLFSYPVYMSLHEQINIFNTCRLGNYLLTLNRLTDTFPHMTDLGPVSVSLKLDVPGDPLTSYRCSNPLELSDAVATQMALAVHPATLLRWMEGEDFYRFWSLCFASVSTEIPSLEPPAPCWFLRSSGRATLFSILSIEAVV